VSFFNVNSSHKVCGICCRQKAKTLTLTVTNENMQLFSCIQVAVRDCMLRAASSCKVLIFFLSLSLSPVKVISPDY